MDSNRDSVAIAWTVLGINFEFTLWISFRELELAAKSKGYTGQHLADAPDWPSLLEQGAPNGMRKTATKQDWNRAAGKGTPFARYLAIALNHMTPSSDVYERRQEQQQQLLLLCDSTSLQPPFLNSSQLNSLCGYKNCANIFITFQHIANPTTCSCCCCSSIVLVLVLLLLLLGASLLTLLPAAWLISQAKWLIIRFVVYKTGDNFYAEQRK